MNELCSLVKAWHTRHNTHNPTLQIVKVNEEVGEICREVARGRFHTLDMKDAIGDTFVALIGLCNHLGLTPEECIEYAYNEIKDRKGKIVNGNFVKDEEE